MDEVENNTKYWWSERPKGTVVVAALVIFPVVLAYWAFAWSAKKIMINHAKRQFLKHTGRQMNWAEVLVRKYELDRKFGI